MCRRVKNFMYVVMEFATRPVAIAKVVRTLLSFGDKMCFVCDNGNRVSQSQSLSPNDPPNMALICH